jgi:hypothetical protein
MTGTIAGFTSTGIDDNATSTKVTVSDTGIDVTGTVTSDGLTVDTSDQVIINHSADGGGIRIDSTNATNTGSLRFGDVADNYIGALEYDHSVDAMTMYVNNAERMRISSAGNVTVSTGNLVIGTSGKGIDFSAATPDGTGTTGSEVLDDYEEGTWTPGLMTAAVNLSSVTYHTGVNGGRYTKIGSRVFLTGTLYTTAVTKGSATGNVGINGLPFTPATSSLGQNGMESATISEVDGWVTNNPDGMRIEHGSTYIRMFYRATSNGASVDIAAAHISTAANRNLVRFAISYETA